MTFLGSVTLDLGEGVIVDVGVEIAWAPPKCDHCVIFWHSADNCYKVGVTKGGVDVGSAEGLELLAHVGAEPDVHVDSPVVSLPLGEEAASVGRFVQGEDSDRVVSCDVVIERIDSARDFAAEEGHVVMSVSSPNRFKALGAGVEVVDKQGRVAANGVAVLMNQLKPNARGRKHQHGKGGKHKGGNSSPSL
ncbi:hypothetical protein V6N12_008184 [Hibiscus sabdariffa]|uniref:Uncharacterized protein n=1 Tax=Hibiscus sabdariffa TaxID=183260 RepID=A0ABR2B3Q1_9ROSI